MKDLKKRGLEELRDICDEIRSRIISVCLKNGGHIGASLGTVELAVALHRVFDSPKDALIWDVGHQAYAHKLLTGRDGQFHTLRQTDGLSGFLSREESPHDIFGAGHSSTSLSAALGVAHQNPNWTVAIIGDGGLTAGVALEALNQFTNPDLGPTLVILNDNQMSISENVGSLHRILSDGRAAHFFELFGFDYAGPIDGHDLSTLLGTINGVKSDYRGRPVILHVLTQKGKGYAPAESRPAAYHGVGPMQAASTKTRSVDEPKTATWSDLFCRDLMLLADQDPKIIAITAAMGEGTGLIPFAKKYPTRFFDVGIAEQHAVTFAAGLATQGWKPVVAIYSTFLQRALDAMIHDVALQKLPVVFAVDRAGLVGADGPTHHGVYDLAFTKMIPGFKIFTPEKEEDFFPILKNAFASPQPTLIRYPRGKAETVPATLHPGQDHYQDSPEQSQLKKVVVTVGPIGLRVAQVISSQKLEKQVEQLHLIQVKPIDPKWILHLNSKPNAEIIIYEEGSRVGGIGESLRSMLSHTHVRLFGIPDRFIPHGAVKDQEDEIGFSIEKITKTLKEHA